MTFLARASRQLRPVIILAVGVALVSAAIWFSRPLTSSAAPLPPNTASAAEAEEGVVCFGAAALEHGIASLSPLQPGRVALILVAENQEVAQGAELLRLDDAAARSKLIEAEVGVELAQLQVVQSREAARAACDPHRPAAGSATPCPAAWPLPALCGSRGKAGQVGRRLPIRPVHQRREDPRAGSSRACRNQATRRDRGTTSQSRSVAPRSS